MKCYHHIDTDAVGTCTVCGRPICEECSGAEKGSGICPECTDVLKPASIPPRPSTPKTPPEPPGGRKSTGAAFILSLFLPGLGHLYVGELLKALVFFLLFFHVAIISGDGPSLGILVAAIYIYQIYDAVRCARATRANGFGPDSEPLFGCSGRDSRFWAWFLIVVGVIFQLHTLEIFGMGNLPRLLPIVLIIVGIKLIMGGSRRKIAGSEAYKGVDSDDSES